MHRDLCPDSISAEGRKTAFGDRDRKAAVRTIVGGLDQTFIDELEQSLLNEPLLIEIDDGAIAVCDKLIGGEAGDRLGVFSLRQDRREFRQERR